MSKFVVFDRRSFCRCCRCSRLSRPGHLLVRLSRPCHRHHQRIWCPQLGRQQPLEVKFASPTFSFLQNCKIIDRVMYSATLVPTALPAKNPRPRSTSAPMEATLTARITRPVWATPTRDLPTGFPLKATVSPSPGLPMRTVSSPRVTTCPLLPFPSPSPTTAPEPDTPLIKNTNRTVPLPMQKSPNFLRWLLLNRFLKLQLDMFCIY